MVFSIGWRKIQKRSKDHGCTKRSFVRFLKHIHLTREAPKDMEDYFRKRTMRRVAKDRTVSLNGRLFEAPTGLIGKIVTLLYHDHDPSQGGSLLLKHLPGIPGLAGFTHQLPHPPPSSSDRDPPEGERKDTSRTPGLLSQRAAFWERRR